MHHNKFIKPEKDLNCNDKDCRTKLKKHKIFVNKRDQSNNVDTLSNSVKNKPQRKLSNDNLIHESRNQPKVLKKENEDRTRTLDLILNFEWRKKKSNNYVNAYYTDSDLNKRKMFHESNSSKNLNTLNLKVTEDKQKNIYYRPKNKNYFLNIKKEKKGKAMVDNGKRELEELFRTTDTDFKTYCQDDDIFKDLNRYFKTTNQRKSRKGCVYRLTNDASYGRTTIYSPERKCSSINLLLNKQDKVNNYYNVIVKNDSSKDIFNFIDNSTSTACAQEKKINDSNIIQFKTIKNKSKNTLVDGGGCGSFTNCFGNDENFSVSSEKDSIFSSKSRTLAKSKHFNSDFNINAHCGESKHVYYDNYIHQNPEKLLKGMKTVNATSTSIYKPHSNKDYNDFVLNMSDSSILDYSISRRKQESINKSFSGQSTELPSDCTIINYDIARKKSRSYQSLRKPSCEIFMNRIKKKKNENLFDYKHFKKEKSGTKSITTKRNQNLHYNFEETCKSYIIDRNLRKYKVRNTDTYSEFIPPTQKYSYVVSNVNRPNSIERDSFLQTFDDVASNTSKIFNYDMPFNLKMPASHKFEFNEADLALSQILNIDDSLLKSKQSNDITLKLSIPNIYVVKKSNNDSSSKKLYKNEKSIYINDSDNDIFKCNYLRRKEISNGAKKQIDKNFVDQDFQPFSSDPKYKNCKINKSYKNSGILKADTGIAVREKEVKNSNQNIEVQIKKEINKKLLNDTILIYKSNGDVYERDQNVCNNNVEVIFPINPNKIFSSSQTILTNRTVSSKVRFSKSDTSQHLEKTDINKAIPIKKRVLIDENRNCSIFDFVQDKFPIKECLEDNSPLNDTGQNNNSSTKMCDQVLSKCTDLLNSSKFKMEIEKIVNKYLEKKVIINWLGHKKFNILVFADDKLLKNNPQKLIETLQNQHKQAITRKIKTCSYKLHKFQANCPSVLKNDETKNNACCSKIDKASIRKPGDSKIPYKLVLCENCLECKNVLNASKIKSLPIFNLSKLKIKKRSVTYYSKFSSHSMKIKRCKRKIINKQAKNRIHLSKHKSTKINDKHKNILKNQESDNRKTTHNPKGSKLFKELDAFKTILSEVEKKQDSILSFLNLDPCGLLFTFPGSTQMMKM